MNEGNFIEKNYWRIFAVFMLLAAILYLLIVQDAKVYGDEAYTMVMIRHSFAEIWNITAADVHPPLHYFILKALTYPFGYSLAVARIVSIIPYLFIIALGGIQFKKLFNAKTALLFMALFFMYPATLPAAVSVRMYSFATAFVFANAVFAYRCYVKNGKADWVFYVIFGTAAAYTHYFAMVSVGIIYGILLIAIIAKKRGMAVPWIISSIATIVLYLPWIKCFIGQLEYKVNNEYWMQPITLHTFFSYVRGVFSINNGKTTATSVVFGLLCMTAYLIAFIYVLLTRNKKDIILSVCALAVPFGTIAVGVAASLLVRPVFDIRYVRPSIPLMVFFMAFALAKIKKKALVLYITAVALAGVIIEYGMALQNRFSTSDFNANFASDFEFADCYVTSGNYGFYSELAYYEMEKPIFSSNYLTESDVNNNPYTNLFSINDFDASKYDTVVMLLSAGRKPSDEWTSMYNSEFVAEYDDSMDVFLLMKK